MIKKITDQLGREIEYSYPPKRIISLCPGITETLFALALEEELIGRTRYCIYPEDQVGEVIEVGGTKEINIELIRKLKPDLIIAEKEENTKAIVESLEKEFSVYVAEVQSIPDAFEMISEMGKLTARKIQADGLIERIQTAFETVPRVKGKRAAYVIWKKPFMVAGNHTYIHSLLERMGFTNVFATYDGRYPVITEEDFKSVELDYLFLASEPYPFTEKHKEEFTAMMPNVQPINVDGEMFWYGARMEKAAGYFKSLLKTLD